MRGFDVRFGLLNLAVAYLCHLAVVAFALGYLCLAFHLLDVGFLVLDSCYIAFLLCPTGVHLGGLRLEGLELLLDVSEFGFVVLSFYCFALNLQLLYLPIKVVQLFGLGVHLQPQFGCRFVHKVDGFVRQETVGDIARGERYGGDECIVFDTHLVVGLVALFQAPQDRDGRRLVGLIHHHRLETALQGFVALEVFLILVQRGGTYRP